MMARLIDPCPQCGFFACAGHPSGVLTLRPYCSKCGAEFDKVERDYHVCETGIERYFRELENPALSDAQRRLIAKLKSVGIDIGNLCLSSSKTS